MIPRRQVINITAQQHNSLFSNNRPPLQPLAAQPVPNINNPSDTTDTGEESSNLKCSICLEFLNNPVGCGNFNCPSRFCRACLTRYATSSNINSNRDRNATSNEPSHDAANNNRAQCPCCRVEFDTDNFLVDEALRNRMEHEYVTCPNFGCNARVSRCNLKNHEERSCDYIKVRCRYVSFGCKWSGTRKCFKQHETRDCSFAKISGLVEQVRQLKSTNDQQGQQIQFVRNQLNQATQLIHLQGTTLMAMQQSSSFSNSNNNNTNKNADNILDLYEGIFFCAYNPVNFMRETMVWRHLYATPNVRSKMYDAMFYLPTFLVAIKIISGGLHDAKLAFQLENVFDDSSSSLQQQDSILEQFMNDTLTTVLAVQKLHTDGNLDGLLLSIVVTLCVWLAVVTYLLDRRMPADSFVMIGNTRTLLFHYDDAGDNHDNAGSMRNTRALRWSARLNPTLHPLNKLYFLNRNNEASSGYYYLFRDVHVTALTTIYVCLFSYFNSAKAGLIWLFAVSTSMVFTCVVARIVHASSKRITAADAVNHDSSAVHLNLYQESRGLAAMQCALRYGFLISTCGLREAIYAVFVLEMILRITNMEMLLPEYMTMREQDFLLTDPSWQVVINFAVIGHMALHYMLSIANNFNIHENAIHNFSLMDMLLSEKALDEVFDAFLDYGEALCVLMLLNICVSVLQGLGKKAGEAMALKTLQSVLVMQQDAASNGPGAVVRNQDSGFVSLWWVLDLALILFI